MHLYLILCALTLTPNVKSIYHVQIPEKEECSCFCSKTGDSNMNICQKLTRFEKELSTVKDAIEHRTRYINELNELREKLEWQDFLVDTLSKQVELFKTRIPENPKHLIPEPLTMKPEGEMQNDSGGNDIRTNENEVNFIRNVSNLLAKVEEVENMTMEVHEELKSERRVRRHIEEDLNETRSSLKVLGDKFMNFSFPTDGKTSHVEEIVISSIESLNKTLFEDHLQKLYYKVDNVAYKNETKKLDERLENLESELLVETNSSIMNTFLKKIKDFSDSFHGIFNGFNDTMEANELRLKLLEEKFETLDEMGLNNQVEILLKTSNLTQHSVSKLWAEMKEIKNSTTYHHKKFESFIDKIETDTSSIDFTKFSLEIDNLKHNISETQDSVRNVENNLKILNADIAIVEDKFYKLSFKHESGFKDIDEKIENMTQMWISAITVKQEENVSSKNKKFEELVTIQQPAEFTDLEEFNDTNYDLLDELINVDGILNTLTDKENTPCSLPDTLDIHLLLTIINNTSGDQELVMACKPIGQYILSEYVSPIVCNNGKWNQSLPVCRKLLTEEEIQNSAMKIVNMDPCLEMSPGEKYPDPINCNRYFKCFEGKSVVHRCPSGRIFDHLSNSCKFSELASCMLHETPLTEMLENLLPTILIEPNNMDKPYSLMGTDPLGQLVVYPGKNFKVHCLYPANMWGLPTLSIANLSSWILSEKTAPNRVTMNFNNPTGKDSNVYSCITPFNKKLSITVIIKDISCPSIESEFNHNVYYRPHPEGMSRVISTIAIFQCEGSKTVTATCLPTGQWSRSPPNLEECPQSQSKPWQCPDLNDFIMDPSLILEPREKEKVVLFKCAGNYRLIGNPFTRCREDGTWSHHSLPRCMRR